MIPALPARQEAVIRMDEQHLFQYTPEDTLSFKEIQQVYCIP